MREMTWDEWPHLKYFGSLGDISTLMLQSFLNRPGSQTLISKSIYKDLYGVIRAQWCISPHQGAFFILFFLYMPTNYVLINGLQLHNNSGVTT